MNFSFNENNYLVVYMKDGSRIPVSEEMLCKSNKNRLSYKALIDLCCDDMVLNNNILNAKYESFDLCNGDDYDPERGDCVDIMQAFIISAYSAKRLIEKTNEIVYYSEDLDLYVLGVTHCGMAWDYVETEYEIKEKSR